MVSDDHPHRSFRLSTVGNERDLLLRLKSFLWTTFRQRSTYARLVFLFGTVVLSHASFHSARRIYLYHVFGWQAVHQFDIEFEETPRGRDWTVSTGQTIPNGSHIRFLWGMALWIASVLVWAYVVRRILRSAFESPSSERDHRGVSGKNTSPRISVTASDRSPNEDPPDR